MHILLIHQFFLRDGEAGGSRFNDMTKTWVESGHRVTVIAGAIHYQSGRAIELPEVGHVDVRRVSSSEHVGHARFSRLRSYASFALRATSELSNVSGPDVVIASSPSLPVAVPGMAAASRWDIPFVFEVRDLWPESAITTGVLSRRSIVAQASYALEELAYETADRVVALTPKIGDDIVERGFSREKVSTIPNGVDLDTVVVGERDFIREQLGWENRFVVLYAGAHGIANNLDTLIRAARIAKQTAPELLFVTVGDGPLKPALQHHAKGLDNLRFLDPVPKADIYALVDAADAGVAVLQKNPTFRTVYPNKIFDYMAVGRPVICAIEGAAADLVEEYRAGVCVPFEDHVAIVNAAVALSESRFDYSGSKRAVANHFDRPVLAKQYLSLLNEIV